MKFSYEEVSRFIYREARHLDDKDWDAWLGMYARDCRYFVPSWDDDGELTTDPTREISLMYYGRRDGLEDRVFRIKTEKSSASMPQPRTSHNISNIEILRGDGESCELRFNWVTFSYRYQKVDTYFGSSYYRLRCEEDGLKIVDKRVVLKNDCIHQVVDVYHL